MSIHLLVRLRLTGLVATLLLTCGSLCAQDELPFHRNDIQQIIEVQGAVELFWPAQEGLSVRSFRGNASLVQGNLKLSAHHIVVFEELTEDGYDVRIYAEESGSRSVVFEHLGQRETGARRTLRLRSQSPVQSTGTQRTEVTRADGLLNRAQEAVYPELRQRRETVSVAVTQDSFTSPGFNNPVQLQVGPTRRITIQPRTSDPIQFSTVEQNDTIPPETTVVITGGVNVLVEATELTVRNEVVPTAVVDLSADRVVIWMESGGSGIPDLSTGMPMLQSGNTKFQVYLEGNILFRHKGNILTGSHAIYDASNGRSVFMNAELRAHIPSTGGDFRVRAERLRQLGPDRFHAENAWTTTSPYGKPGYRIESRNIFVEPGPSAFGGRANPRTGRVSNEPTYWVTAEDSRFLLGDIPLLYLPRVSVPAEDPGIPIRSASVKQDRIFGFQVKTVWDLTKLTGVEVPPGTEWDLLADYSSKRGPGIGSQGLYDFQNRMGQVTGEFKMMYQYDDGVDVLGLDRRALIPKDVNRGQVVARHRQRTPNGLTLFGEVGLLSDRNYLDQYDEFRFDRDKDVETLIGARQDMGAFSGSIMASPSLYEFDTTTEWLPRGDLYGFSVPLLEDSVYWSSHSSLGYAHLDPSELPTDPADPFSPTLLGTPYIRDAHGMVAMTRHQLDAPFMLGPVNINPWIMGEAAHWDDGLLASDISRLVGTAGVRATLTATKVMPFVQSELWNLNGLAHKSEKSIEWSITESSRGLGEIAQYNEFDETAQERLRNRAVLQIFPGLVPAEFDPRYYAVRNGAGLWVSAPYHELVDDQQVVRMRWRNRLQTKVGPTHNPRTRDWMIWETGLSYFPSELQNFGEHFGLAYGNYRWNLNDRTSLLADGIWDFFQYSQNYYNFGILSQRSTRGSVYLSYRHVQARHYLDSEIITASYSYRMSPKWISTAAVSYDIGQSESRGSSVTLSRIGLDFVTHFGFGVDTSKGNVGVGISIEPRFGPPTATNMGYLLGLQTQ